MRGQAHTLEAIIGSVLLLTSLVFALQVTAVTPLSASTSSQHIENQQQATAEGVLATATDRNVLKPAVLYWNDASREFQQSDFASAYSNKEPTNGFGEILERQLGGGGLAYNVFVRYQLPTGGIEQQRMVYQGEPSDNAVAAQTIVTLYDDDVLYEPESDGDATDFDVAQPTTQELADSSTDFYAEDAATGSNVFNVVEVEVVVWRQ